MATQETGSDFKERINVPLLHETSSRPNRTLCCFTLSRKAAIVGIVVALLLILVVLLAVFARPSSVDKISNHHYSFIRLPRHISPIEYHVYLHPNLTTFKFSGKVDVLLYCTEAADNITLHIGNKLNYFSVQVAYIPDLNDKQSKQALEVKKISRLSGEMIWIALDRKLQSRKYYFLVIEFDSELSRGLSGFYLSKYTATTGEMR